MKNKKSMIRKRYNQEEPFLTNQTYCSLCQNKQYSFRPQPISAHFIDTLTDSCQFPFAAFGLLIDNSVYNGATILNIKYQKVQIKNSQEQVMLLRFEDDAKILWKHEDLAETILNYQCFISFFPTGIDRRVKLDLTKENQRKQFGLNMKLGGLRLGKQILYVSRHQEETRVFLITRQTFDDDQNNPCGYEFYNFYHYCLKNNDEIVCQMMNTSRNKIEDRYYDLIYDATHKKNIKNVLFIFEPKIHEKQDLYGLCLVKQKNDIYYGDKQKISELVNKGVLIYESIDVSLKSYISLLYLKNQLTKIKVSFTKDHYENIYHQSYLEKIDKFNRQRLIQDLDGIVDFDFKMTEIYYISDEKASQNFFSNGLLFYHKNRLISRFNIQIGQILHYYCQNQNFSQNFKLFGYAELPQNLTTNVYKTGFIHIIMLQRLFTRLKFVNEIFNSKNYLTARSRKRLINGIYVKNYLSDNKKQIMPKNRQIVNNSDEEYGPKSILNKQQNLKMSSQDNFQELKLLKENKELGNMVDSQNMISNEKSA